MQYREKPAMLFAIGGPSGVGKTTIVHELKRRFSEKVRTFPAFTTRAPRPEEQEGADYYFRTEEDLEEARKNPRYGGFIQARGNWYWMDVSYIRQVIREDPSRLYLFVLTQRREFEEYKRLFPQLKWLWIYADEEEIAKRLRETGRDVVSSLQYNRRLQEETIDDLVDRYIVNSPGEIERALEEILRFWRDSSLPSEAEA